MGHGGIGTATQRVASGRRFVSELPAGILDNVQGGVRRTVYRGVPFYKSPFDISLYLQLLSKLAPRTVIEIGTKFGGSALWFADMLSAHQIADSRVISIDISPQNEFSDTRITFLEGDAKALGDILSPAMLIGLPRPFLVVEDSSHFYPEAMAVLEFFHPYLQGGDYIVVEDGVVTQLTNPHFRVYEDGPSVAVAEFLAAHPDEYEIDTDLCDRFGFNVTYNPNGWLRRA